MKKRAGNEGANERKGKGNKRKEERRRKKKKRIERLAYREGKKWRKEKERESRERSRSWMEAPKAPEEGTCTSRSFPHL